MKKKLITSALPYVNNVPHLGNIIGSVLSADVFARFCRSMGYETLYICATDEYGTATENKARDEKLTPQQICDKYHLIHKDIYDFFNIRFDFFGRTSTPEHTEVTQDYFLKIKKNGCILEQTEDQVYCESCAKFLADRYVEGTCPHCNYNGARGDQCDKCGKLLQPQELLSPICAHCHNRPVRKPTSHLYIDLPKLSDKIAGFAKKAGASGNWTLNAVTTTEGWLRKGLEARPITRDLTWGVPVPHKGYESKVFYVWFDAPIGYVSQTKRHLPDRWEYWWKNPDGTELYQFMAKDNIPFHTVMFPAYQIATGEDWTMLHHISSTEYLNYEGTKFSKSLGIGVFGNNVRETGIDVEIWRLYLLLNRPEKADSDFSWQGFFEEINSTFIDNIGNLLNRLSVFIQKHFEGILPPVNLSGKTAEFSEFTRSDFHKGVELYDRVMLRDATHHVLFMGHAGNKFFQEQKPWELIKTDRTACAAVLAVITELLYGISLLLAPVMPKTAGRIADVLGTDKGEIKDGLKSFNQGHRFGEPQILFLKQDVKMAEVWREKFSGGRSGDAQQAETKTSDKQEVKTADKLTLFNNAALKVGKIISVRRHPNAERLYIEQIDCGESAPRQVISGIVQHFSEAELLNRHVLVVTGLKPAVIRKENSAGMLLTFEAGEKLELPDLSAHAPGTPVIIKEPAENTPAKREQVSVDEFYSLGLKLTDGTVTLDGNPLTVGDKPLTAPTFKEGQVT